jgi:hypothetical protein
MLGGREIAILLVLITVLGAANTRKFLSDLSQKRSERKTKGSKEVLILKKKEQKVLSRQILETIYRAVCDIVYGQQMVDKKEKTEIQIRFSQRRWQLSDSVQNMTNDELFSHIVKMNFFNSDLFTQTREELFNHVLRVLGVEYTKEHIENALNIFIHRCK